MANRVPAKGMTLSYDVAADSPRAWTTFGSVFEMPTPTGEKPEIDATALEDTAAVFFLDIPDFGSTAFRFFVEPTAAAQVPAMQTYRDADTVLEFRALYPISVAGNSTNATTVWQGRVQTLGIEGSVRGMVTGTLGIRATGAALFTVESA